MRAGMSLESGNGLVASEVEFCMDCGIDTGKIGEFYMVAKEAWEAAVPDSFDRTGMLCIGCIERRLKRTLRSDDFIDCRINTDHAAFPKSRSAYSKGSRRFRNFER
jgi:hypothetical protein